MFRLNICWSIRNIRRSAGWPNLELLERILTRFLTKKVISPSVQTLNISNLSLPGSADLNVWKFNEEKTLAYLERKVRRLSKALIEKGVNAKGGAESGNFISTLKEKPDEGDSDPRFLKNLSSNEVILLLVSVEYLRFAFGIMSDYLEPEMAFRLQDHLKLPKEEPKKRKDPENLGNESKKKRTSANEEPDEDYSKGYKKAGPAKDSSSLTAKQKALAKTASGTKSIASFFKKK